MLDIHGQPGPAVQPAVAAPTQPAQPLNIPTISGESTKLTQGLAVGVVLLVLAAGGYLSYDQSTKQGVIEARTREVTELKRVLAEPARVQLATTADQLKASVATLEGAVVSSSAWSDFLQKLTLHTAPGIVLENVTADEDWLVRVTGSAKTYVQVAQLLSSLKASGSFASVELDSSALSEDTEGTAVTFSLKAVFVPSEEPVQSEQQSSKPFGEIEAFAVANGGTWR